MKRSAAKRKSGGAATSGGGSKLGLVGLAITLVAAIAVAFYLRSTRAGKSSVRLGPLTYHRDIAPIVLHHCAPCHRPGQAGPFHLLTCGDVQKRARQVREVVEQRLMPPWLPDPGDGPFVGQRALTADQVAVIRRWVEQGAPEGKPAEAPPPQWSETWELGRPDLVVQMTEPFTLPAEGPDVYRNFIIPIPTTTRRYVKGLELQPGNARIVHHAFMRIDPTRESRKRDDAEPGPGFGGLHTPVTAQTPPGQFLSWQPGKRHTFTPPGLAWVLETNCDLILQVHLRPSGKPETLQSSIAFYFTSEAPTNTPFKVGLRDFAIDVPAGATNHTVEQTYSLAADVDVLSVLPHAHYLGRRFTALATLPDGRQQPLLRIANWDFNWQGEYLFQRPVFLPRGTTISMRWQYDNSTNNVRNPNTPPQRVRYGLQSSDEMAELWLQVLPRRPEDTAALARYDRPRAYREALAYNQYLLTLNANDARAHTEIGKARLFLGQHDDALASLRRAVELDPALDEPHYFAGLIFRLQERLPEAAAEFTAALRINPMHAKAHGNLGFILQAQGRAADAERHFREALRLNPQDELARQALEEIARRR